MQNFSYQNKTRIIFGKDTHREVGALVKPYAGKVLLHYGGGSIKKSGLFEAIMASLNNSGIEVVELGGVQPNPTLMLVHEGIELCRREHIGFILAVGGGSVIDSAKAIALGAAYDGDVWDFFLSPEMEVKHPVPPLGVVLTLPASGSEASISIVITKEDEERKLASNREVSRPEFSIINPELFFTLPKNQIANGACDMMGHIFERYFTNTINAHVTDGMCESVLKSIMYNATLLMRNNRDYHAWADLALAGTLAHCGLLGVGREEDWASHRIEHELSAIDPGIAHGAGLAVIYLAWMRYVYKDNLPMFTQFACRVMEVDGSLRQPEELACAAIDKLERFYRSLGLPTRLSELNVDSKNFELMAKRATWATQGPERPLGNFKKLVWQDVLAIYKLADK